VPLSHKKNLQSQKKTVQLIHDVVDKIKKTSDLLSPGREYEGNQRELEDELNKGFSDGSSSKLVNSKIKHKFSKKTVTTFRAKKFDIEKKELKFAKKQ